MFCPRNILALALLASGVTVSYVRAVVPTIQDDARFFSPTTIANANEQIYDMYRRYERDLLVETFETVPPPSIERVKELKGEERAKFFEDWAKDRMQRRLVNGVYILVCRDPSYVQIGVSPKAGVWFDQTRRRELRELLVDRFRNKRFDDGLEEAVKMVKERMATAK